MSRIVFLSCSFIFITGCSHQKTLKKEMEGGEVSVNAVVNLARSSYLKGCTEGYKLALKDQERNAYLFCRQKAEVHAKEIKQIVK